MKDTTQSSLYDTFLYFMHHPVVKGSFVGAIGMFAATPGFNAFSHEKGIWMPRNQLFTGWQSLVASGIAGTSTSFTINKMLGGNQEDASFFHRTWATATAGAFSGIVLCPFECITQNRLLSTQNSLKDTTRSIVQYHGYKGFFNGTAAMIVREGSWTLMYMTAVPMISQRLQNAGYNKRAADVIALIVSASMFGIFSTPVNHLRRMKQCNLTNAGTTRSYPQLASQLFHEHSDRAMPQKIMGCFKGAGVRSLNSAWAGFFFCGASEAYNTALEYLAPEATSCKPA